MPTLVMRSKRLSRKIGRCGLESKLVHQIPNTWLIELLQLSKFHCIVILILLAEPVSAKVAVLANRTVKAITVDVHPAGELAKQVTIASGDSQPLFFQRSLQVRFGEGLEKRRVELRPSSAYFLTRGADGETLGIEQIGLGEQDSPQPQQPTPQLRPRSQPVTVAVKLFVDDNEPTHRRIWEPKLRKRLAEASEILERHSGVRLKVIEVGTWDSNDQQMNFLQSLREFETEVKPQPAQLAIGFSSQYQAKHGRSHMGVTRWPMHTHILLRERSRNLLEAERLELLVHEIGHYFGASHSPEPQSVMRPVLTRGPQRRVGSRIQFDPVNALLVALVGEEIRNNKIRNVKGYSKPTVERLKQIYGILKQAMPHDPAASQHLRILELASAPRRIAQSSQQNQKHSPLVRDTRQVLDHLMDVARREGQQDEPQTTGDELTNLYVQQAAQAATRVRKTNAKRAMLLALGIFLDDTATLRSFPGTGAYISLVESEAQRVERIEVLGKPTMRERNDLTKHFFLSAHLVVVGGKQATSSAGLAKEMLDAQGDSGFSFVDMAANQAGILFAEHLLADKISLLDLARGFHVDDYLPTLVGLEEGFSSTDLQSQFGGPDQPTINSAIEQIKQRVLDLPVYDQLAE